MFHILIRIFKGEVRKEQLEDPVKSGYDSMATFCREHFKRMRQG